MNFLAPKSRLHPLSLLMGTLLVLAMILGGAFSASPELHHLVHADSSHPQHQCLATVLSQHGVEVAQTPVCLPAFSLILVWEAPEHSVKLPTPAHRYGPGARGPPACV